MTRRLLWAALVLAPVAIAVRFVVAEPSGSIVGNLLLVLGPTLAVGGRGRCERCTLLESLGVAVIAVLGSSSSPATSSPRRLSGRLAA